ncbi:MULTISPECIES: biopolymer transporter ExbD [Xanthomonas]|uniref:Biopolymer transporter ExbD n=1 Tax=Xanthomonas dyei TaxID=743699 RepID=A0ABZ0DA38_9XANT|nr:biopolymer transporter ExbD [Xanthomonas dyei]MCC4634799.1 biopolymer transporter ExbD [Xanthomonas dyei pv. eucalypti]WOB24545.1 biopolymer transporter ExbD [Xanthomonas dyei]WOB52173.1 biopolymer transporter ExbD [Xanthomonas dyei]
MRIGSDRSQDEPQIDLVPLIDVILVLIIFFVVTTTFDARSTLQLQLPTASDQNTSAPPRSLSVLVNADGHYFINDQEVLRADVESLKQTIAQIAGDDREQTVLMRADARTPYQAVVTAQDALGQLGFRRIAIATAPQTGAAGKTSKNGTRQ